MHYGLLIAVALAGCSAPDYESVVTEVFGEAPCDTVYFIDTEAKSISLDRFSMQCDEGKQLLEEWKLVQQVSLERYGEKLELVFEDCTGGRVGCVDETEVVYAGSPLQAVMLECHELGLDKLCEMPTR